MLFSTNEQLLKHCCYNEVTWTSVIYDIGVYPIPIYFTCLVVLEAEEY